jgi:hypothetical protein
MRNIFKKFYTCHGKKEPVFIECRFRGRTRDYFKDLNRELTRHGSERIRVPHMALIYGLNTSDFEGVKKKIETIASTYDLVRFETQGFGKFDEPDTK